MVIWSEGQLSCDLYILICLYLLVGDLIPLFCRFEFLNKNQTTLKFINR